MRTLSVIAGITFFSNLVAQNFSTEHTSLVLRDTQRKNRKVEVEIYYPEEQSGRSLAETEADNGRFPLICFGHGYLLSGVWYQHVCDILVPQGYILVFPNSESGLFPSHKTLAEDMCFVLNEISRLGADSTFFLYNRVDTAKCLMGHSMGGGALFLGAEMNGSVDAVVGLAAIDTRPSSIKAVASVTVPTLIFAGGNDCIAPAKKHQIPIFNSSASPDKTYIMITGGTHCQMGVSHPKCILGEKMARCSPGISEEEQLRILTRYLIPWLGYFLKGETEEGVCFDLTLSADNTVTYLQSRPLSVAAE
jgi:predicted dienelactone hydrolase